MLSRYGASATDERARETHRRLARGDRLHPAHTLDSRLVFTVTLQKLL